MINYVKSRSPSATIDSEIYNRLIARYHLSVIAALHRHAIALMLHPDIFLSNLYESLPCPPQHPARTSRTPRYFRRHCLDGKSTSRR